MEALVFVGLAVGAAIGYCLGRYHRTYDQQLIDEIEALRKENLKLRHDAEQSTAKV